MWRLSLFAAGALLILLTPALGYAGRNAGGTAWLSWDETVFVTDLKKVPSAEFPLFVQLKNAPDVRALAIHLRWCPFDPLVDCYNVLPAPGTASCGAAVAIPPGGDFAGDTSYTWSIKFSPLDSGRACVEYLVSAGSCAARVPSDFLLASVVVKDSKGAVDTLKVGDRATTLGGSLLAIDGVDPSEIPARTQTVIAIRGTDFVPEAQVDLHGPGSRVTATKVLVLGSTLVTASVKAPDSPGSLLDLIVRLHDGRTAQLPAAIRVSAPPLTPQSPSSMAKPTNDMAAFRKFDLNSDRISQWNIHDHSGLYPSGRPVWSNSLLVVRSAADTMGLFKSTYGAGIDFNCGCQGIPSYVGYAVTPPQYATSIGMLSMATGAYNGTGEFNDYNVPALRLTWTFIDGDSASQTVRIGKHVRNHFSGSQQCNGIQPYYTLVPDSLAAPLDSISLPPPADPGSLEYFDAQEMPLNPQVRSKKLTALRINAVERTDYCGSTPYSSEHWLYGFSIWPNFRIKNRLSQDLPFYSQGGTQPYGGYVIGDSLYGQRKDLSANGCLLSCYAMALKYYGLDYTPATLNTYLQNTRGGYVRAVSGKIDTVNGYNVTFKEASADLKVDTEFLIERPARQPLATVRVLRRNGTNGTGIILKRHLTSPVQVDDECVVYGNIDPGRILRLGAFSIENYGGGSAAPDLVERALTDSFPVILEEPGNPTHFVVAHGWEPAFVSADSARGTYPVRDPGFNVQRLIQDRYGNKFIAARGLRRKNPSGVPAPQLAAAVEEADEALTIGINGPARAYITDPLGRVIRLDEQLGDYVTSIPDVVTDRRVAVDDHDDPATGGEPVDLICLRNAVSGQYDLQVQSEGEGVVWISGSAYHDVTAEAHSALAHVATSGMQARYRLAYSPGATPMVNLEYLPTTDVPQAGRPEQLTLRLAANPARGQMPLIYGLPAGVPGILELFDISGRRIRTMRVIGRSSGEQWVWWDGRDDNGVARPSGIYLVRLRAGRDVKFLRGVFLR